MSTSLDSSPRVADVLDAVRELAPEIRSRAAEVESARRVPLDLLDDLKDAGCFGLLLPSTHGGTGSDLAGAMRVFEELSRADASVAWITLIGGGALARPRRTSAVDLRRDVSPGSRHHRRRGVQPDRNRGAGRGRLPGQRPVVVRERLRARRLDLRKLHRHLERRTAAPDRGLPARRGRDRGHVVGRRPLRHREPPLQRSRCRRPRGANRERLRRPAVGRLDLHEHPHPRQPRPAAGDRAPRHRPRPRSTTSSISRPTRCRCCRRRRSRRTRCSSTSSRMPT